MILSLENRTALVTGAAQNIGLAISEYFLRAGARVAMVDYNAEKLAKSAQALPGEVLTLSGDLRNPARCAEIVAEAADWGGNLDVLVNNAFAGKYQGLLQLDDESWASELGIGLTAMMATCRAALPGMMERGGGSIINVGSMNSFTPGHNMAAYATVKGGIVNFTRQIAVEFGPAGVRANTLCPGFITHEERDRAFAEQPLEKERVLSTIPLRRLGQAEDCAQAALFLASEQSAFMTGQTLVIDGGATVQNPKMVTHAFEEALRRGSE